MFINPQNSQILPDIQSRLFSVKKCLPLQYANSETAAFVVDMTVVFIKFEGWNKLVNELKFGNNSNHVAILDQSNRDSVIFLAVWLFFAKTNVPIFLRVEEEEKYIFIHEKYIIQAFFLTFHLELFIFLYF